MIRRVLLSSLMVAGVFTLACSDSPTALSESFLPPAGPIPTIVGLAVSPESTSVGLGEQLTLSVFRVMSNGSRSQVHFPSLSTSPNPRFFSVSSSVTVNLSTGIVSAIAPGAGRIEVLFEGMTASSTIHVREPVASNSVALQVDAFSVIEYNSGGVHWIYAPQLTVSAPTSTSVTILTIQFTVPGWPYPTSLPWNCGGQIPALSQQALNGEVYGSWAWEMFSPGHRASGDITAVIKFVDGTGRAGTMEVKGPVVAGYWPDTYGGDPGACFHGYRGGGG